MEKPPPRHEDTKEINDLNESFFIRVIRVPNPCQSNRISPQNPTSRIFRVVSVR